MRRRKTCLLLAERARQSRGTDPIRARLHRAREEHEQSDEQTARQLAGDDDGIKLGKDDSICRRKEIEEAAMKLLELFNFPAGFWLQKEGRRGKLRSSLFHAHLCGKVSYPGYIEYQKMSAATDMHVGIW